MPRFCAVVALTSCLAGCDLLPELLTPVPFALEVTPEEIRDSTVSYTHLTLPTIYSV